MPKAKLAVLRALELDDSLGEAHVSLARIRMSFDWDWVGAEREFKRALRLNPNYATGISGMPITCWRWGGLRKHWPKSRWPVKWNRSR
jgi:hypothetical protein